MPRLVQRRAALSKTRTRAEKHVSVAVAKSLAALKKELIRHYSGQIEKGMDDLIKEWDAELQKAAPIIPPVPPIIPPPLPPVNQLEDWGGWDDWINEFDTVLSDALIAGAGAIGATETGFWTARGQDGVVYDPSEVVNKYQDRIGRKITDIADETRASVQQDVADWYAEKGSLSDLSDTLEQYFSPARADTIAATEMNNVASEVALDLMDQMGLTSWTWDSFEDWAVCDECDANNGQTFMRDDDMPPAHPNCRCSVSLEEAWQDKQAEEDVVGVEPVDKLLKAYNPDQLRDADANWPKRTPDRMADLKYRHVPAGVAIVKDWDPDLHPRGPDGKFGEGGSDSGPKLPAHVDLSNDSFLLNVWGIKNGKTFVHDSDNSYLHDYLASENGMKDAGDFDVRGTQGQLDNGSPYLAIYDDGNNAREITFSNWNKLTADLGVSGNTPVYISPDAGYTGNLLDPTTEKLLKAMGLQKWDESQHPRGPDGKFGEGGGDTNESNSMLFSNGKGLQIDSIKDGRNLAGYSVVAVAVKGEHKGEIVAASTRLDHETMLQYVGRSDIDNYVRLSTFAGRFETNLLYAGIAFNNMASPEEQAEQHDKALNNVYTAIDTLRGAGVPVDTGISIAGSGPVIRTTFSKMLSDLDLLKEYRHSALLKRLVN